jgi:hypothetical protein
VVGNLPSKLCLACGAGLVAYKENCVSECPSGSNPKTYKDGGVGCIEEDLKLTQIKKKGGS